MIDSRIVRRVAPILFLVVVTSTGTLLASDPCKVFLVQKLTEVTESAQRHTAPPHKHTKATLAAWDTWGKAYLAKHGHPFVPPPRKIVASQPVEKDLKFACEVPQIPTMDKPFAALLMPEEPPFLPDSPALVTELTFPPDGDLPPMTSVVPGDDTGTGLPPYVYEPMFFPPPKTPDLATPPGGGSPGGPNNPPGDGPPGDTPPVSVVPEPRSFVFLATGLVAMIGFRRKVRRFGAQIA